MVNIPAYFKLIIIERNKDCFKDIVVVIKFTVDFREYQLLIIIINSCYFNHWIIYSYYYQTNLNNLAFSNLINYIVIEVNFGVINFKLTAIIFMIEDVIN